MSHKSRVLLVEDDGDWLDIYYENLRSEDYLLDTAQSVNQAFHLLEVNLYDAVVTDLKMLGFGDDFGGFSVLNKTKELNPGTQVVVITAYGTQELAFRATQQGAFDYVVKPPDSKKFRMSVRRAIQASQSLLTKRRSPKTDAGPSSTGTDKKPVQGKNDSIIGNSSHIEPVFKKMDKAANNRQPVLIWGEAGTGKRLIARAIHANSENSNRPFSSVECNLLPKYEDAILRNLPRLKGGTVFLRDLSLLDAKGQSILANILPLSNSLDVRLIATLVTKENDLLQYAHEKSIKGQLLQPFEQLTLFVPPLRQRKGDIMALAGHFISKFIKDIEPTPQITISPEAAKLLSAHNYLTANVRELHDILEYTVKLLGGDAVILPEHLPTLRSEAESDVHLAKVSIKDGFDVWLRQPESMTKLRDILTVYFNDSELRNLSFDLKVDYDDLQGETKSDKARELIAFFSRRDRVIELLRICYELRPNASW